MDAAVWGFIGVVIGGVITGVVSILSEKVKADATSALDGAKRQDDRQLARDDFQRATLVALQEAANDLIVKAAAIETFTHGAEYQKWIKKEEIHLIGDFTFPDGLRDPWLAVERRMMTLQERVNDAHLRAVSAGLIESARRYAASTATDAPVAARQVADDFAQLQVRAGHLIRATFRDPTDRGGTNMQPAQPAAL